MRCRFEVRYGKYGTYFYDAVEEKELTLVDVLNLLNGL